MAWITVWHLHVHFIVNCFTQVYNVVWPSYTINHARKGQITVIHQFNFFPKCLVIFTQKSFLASDSFLSASSFLLINTIASLNLAFALFFISNSKPCLGLPSFFPKCICFSRHIIQFRCKFIPTWTFEVFTIWPTLCIYSILTSRGYCKHYIIIIFVQGFLLARPF